MSQNTSSDLLIEKKLSVLRNDVSKLRAQREQIVLEKGLIAREDGDLRENGAYIALEQKEHALTSKINAILSDIIEISKEHQASKNDSAN